MSTSKRREKTLFRIAYLSFLIAVVAAIGCGDTTPTSARSSAPIGTVQSMDAMAARTAVHDAIVRIVPQLSDARAARGLADALREVDAQLGSTGSLDGRTAARIRTELERYTQVRPNDVAELDAIRLSVAAAAGVK